MCGEGQVHWARLLHLGGCSLSTQRTGVMPVRPRRSAPFEVEPGFYEPAGLWFYGNIRLLEASLAYIPRSLGYVEQTASELDAIEQEAEYRVLHSTILVCGIHNAAQMRAAIVPLRWGCPRIVVFSGGFQFHLGKDLSQEPFLSATLWRECWDARTDLAVSRRAPDKLPSFGRYNPTVDRLIMRLARKEALGLFSPEESETPKDTVKR